jgi:hypothetical protein
MPAISPPIGVNRVISGACVDKTTIPERCGVASNTVVDQEHFSPCRSLATVRQPEWSVCARRYVVAVRPETQAAAATDGHRQDVKSHWKARAIPVDGL